MVHQPDAAQPAGERTSPGDYTSHPHPHLQTFSNFEVPNNKSNEHIQLFNKPE